MTRENALSQANAHFRDGTFKTILARRIAIPTESQNPESEHILDDYLLLELCPAFTSMGFSCQKLTHPNSSASFLYAERLEDKTRPTILGYGHGDVVRGLKSEWDDNLDPWVLTDLNGLWYGRGIADNKGQHTVNMEAMRIVLETRGSLGFNAKFLIEMGEEVGSAGLREVCSKYSSMLKADVLLASDGPRLKADRPTIYLGSRGSINIDLVINARGNGYHSGHWGGIISNPGIQLSHAISCIVSNSGKIQIPEWVPMAIPESVRNALVDCEVGGGSTDPEIDINWGEPGLTIAERVFGWSAFNVLAYKTGNPSTPVNAIPPNAWARCQLRFVVDVDSKTIISSLRRHLDKNGFSMVRIESTGENMFQATRTDPNNPWVQRVARSLSRTTCKKTTILPNVGGSVPNDIFADILNMPTIWVPHSYPGCSQHAPNEHLPSELLREGLLAMTGLYWDLGVN